MNYDSDSDHFGFNLDSSAVSWDVADYINFTGPSINVSVIFNFRIFIDDNDPNYNWSKTASENSWCTGSGTYSDPYIIENLYINAQGFGGMILVKNSNKFFIIRNNWFNYSGSEEFDLAVLLQFTENGLIDENIITYVHGGINMISFSYNNTFSNNIMISDQTTAGPGRAIEIQSDNNTAYNNRIRNFYMPVGAFGSDQVIIDSNYAENTIIDTLGSAPIYLSRCDNSSIVRNVLAGAYVGDAWLIGEVASSGNIIMNNTVTTGELWSFGPETAGAILNAPKLQADPVDTILLDQSNNNLIAHNRLLKGDSGAGAIPGFNIFILMGMIGVISVILLIIIKRNKH